MEFWDALEDSQYLDAVASSGHGPRPLCKWEIPTMEQLQEWEQQVLSREELAAEKNHEVIITTTTTTNGSGSNKIPVETLSLDWYVSSPIGFFFFSSFVKQYSQERQALLLSDKAKEEAEKDQEQPQKPKNSHNTNNGDPKEESGVTSATTREDDIVSFTSAVRDKYAYTRVNFLENLLRFQKLTRLSKNTTNQLLCAKSLLHYLEIPEADPETRDLLLPELTHIRETDLKLPKQTARARLGLSTQAEVEAAYSLNRDETYESNIIGLKGPLLKELVTTLQEWIDTNSRTGIPKGESMPELSSLQGEENNNNNNNDGDNNSDSDGSEIGEQKQDVPDEDGYCSDIASNTAATTGPNANAHANSKKIPINDRKKLVTSRSVNFDSKPGISIDKTLLRRVLTGDVVGDAHNYPRSASEFTFRKAEAIIYESLKRDYGSAFLANSSQYIRMRNFLWFQDRRVVFDDFFVMRVLGRGGFGLVSACQKGTTGKLYAIKVMSKRRIKMKKSVQFVINERKALAAVSECPFIVNLKYSFHSQDELYLILDLMSGGDLGYHLQMKGKFTVTQCLYYAARIMLGLEALHDKGYAYRDMKPENCLLTADGRVKITDLGLATKISPELPVGVVGTRGYWAPEMHKRDETTGKRLPYTYTVDWFSFGCCLAEFISGYNPFRSEKAYRFGIDRGEKAKDKALDCAIREMEPDLSSEEFAPDAADLCRRLLDKDPSSRLGSHGGCEEIMAHPWFKNVDWESIITDKKRPPFAPAKDVNAASQHEIGNFDDKSKATRDLVFDDTDEKAYEDWDWTSPKAFATEVIEFLVHERELGRPLLPFDHDVSCCCVLL